jgi:hypothetical protein
VNATRIAALHRELSRIHGELAEEMAGPDDAPAAPPPSKLKTRRGPRVPKIEASELDRARADANAERLGMLTGGG